MSTTNATPRTQQSSQLPKPPPSRSASSSTRVSTHRIHQKECSNVDPISGFNNCLFYGQEKVAANFSNFVRFIDGTDHKFKNFDRKYNGRVSAIQVSPDFNYLAVNVDDKKGAKMFIHDTRDVQATLREFSTTVLADQICISLTNETILLSSTSSNRRSATVALYGFEGTFLAETSVTPKVESSKFETSYCPADESIICLVSDDCCYLMRATTNIITVFSQITFMDVTCHAWADDVTLSFGTSDGQIRLFRETVPLDMVDLKKLQNNLVGDRDPNQAKVVVMYANDQYLLVYLQIGLVFIFPAGDLKVRWKQAKVVVVNSLKPQTICTFLHIDHQNDNILYGDLESFWMCNIHYAEAVCDDGMRLVTARCSKPIQQISFELKSRRLAVFDSDGLVVVSNMTTKRVLSYSLIKNVVGVAFVPSGNKLLIAAGDVVALYSVLLNELVRGDVIYQMNALIQVMVQNQNSELAALAHASKLVVLQTETCTVLFELALESKQDIIQLKWSATSDFIGILAKKDALYLVDVSTGQIVWNHEYKLRFFVDIAIHGDVIFALGTKFTVARFENKKELEPMNVHYEGVSFSSTSTAVTTTPEGFYYGTKMGSILRAQSDNVENIQMMKLIDAAGISKLEWIVSENLLITGHDNGSVFVLDLNPSNEMESEEDKGQGQESRQKEELVEDVILCRFNDFQRNKFLAKELRVERNLIRAQCKRVFDEFKEKKETEVRQLNETLETSMQAMRDKIQMMQNKFEAKEAANDEQVARLKDEFRSGINEQKNYYENMINDQIRASLARDEANGENVVKINQEYTEKIRNLELQFDQERKDLEAKLLQFKGLGERLRKQLFESESLCRHLQHINVDDQKKHLSAIVDLKRQFEEEKKAMIATMKDLKATILIIENEKQAEVQNVRQQKIRLEALADELSENQTLFDQKNSQIEKLQERASLLEKENNQQDRNIQRLNQKLAIVSTEVEQERGFKKSAELKLKTFEAMVEAMSTEIYDSKKLEKNALAMLAYFKSPNQLLKQTKPHITPKRR